MLSTRILLNATTALTVAAGLVLAATGVAKATPMSLTITVSDGLGTTSQTFTDSATPNMIALATTTIEGVTITGEFNQSFIGVHNILTSSSTSVLNSSGSTASISVVISGQNFTGPASFLSLSGSGTWLETPGSMITQNWYDDPSNVLGANPTNTPGNLVGTFTNTAVGDTSSFAFSPGTSPLAVPDTGLFSMTESRSYTLANGGELTDVGQTEIKSNIPEPASMLLLGLGMIGLGVVRRRRA